MRSTLFFILLFITSLISNAQSWQMEADVDSNFIDELYSTIDANDDFISVGTVRKTNFTLDHPLIVKTGKNGDTLWTKTYDWVEGGFNHIIKTSDGNFMGIGYEIGISPESQVFVSKINSNGDSLWTRRIGGPLREYGLKLAENKDGDIYLAAYTGTNNTWKTYIIKINTGGDTLWTKTYGESYWDLPTAILTTADGGFLLTGYTIPVYADDTTAPYLLKYSSAGDTLWTKTYWNMFGHPNNYTYDMCPTYDGNYVIASSTYIPGYAMARALIKVNPTGDTIWTKEFSPLYNYDYITSIVESPNHDLAISGSVEVNGSAKMSLFMVSPSGDSITTTYYSAGDLSEGNEVRLLKDGGYILTGRSIYNSSALNYSNCFLVRIEGSGNPSSISYSTKNEFIKPFPNPTNENVSFDLQNSTYKELKFSLTNTLNVIVSQKIIPASGNFIYDTDQLPPGMYYYSFSSNKEIVSSGKLIIQR